MSLPHEVIVVDNASADGSAAAVRARFPAAIVIENAENVGFSRANNQGLRRGQGAYALILNSDAEVGPGCVEALAAVLDARPGRRHRGTAHAVRRRPHPGVLRPDARAAGGVAPATARAGRAPRRSGGAAGRPRPWPPPSTSRPGCPDPACWRAARPSTPWGCSTKASSFMKRMSTCASGSARRDGGSSSLPPRRSSTTSARAWREAGAGLEYHRSHLRFYGKHHGWGPRLVLRGALLARGGIGWVTAHGPRGGRGSARRRRPAAPRRSGGNDASARPDYRCRRCGWHATVTLDP